MKRKGNAWIEDLDKNLPEVRMQNTFGRHFSEARISAAIRQSESGMILQKVALIWWKISDFS